MPQRLSLARMLASIAELFGNVSVGPMSSIRNLKLEVAWTDFKSPRSVSDAPCSPPSNNTSLGLYVVWSQKRTEKKRTKLSPINEIYLLSLTELSFIAVSDFEWVCVCVAHILGVV